MNIDEIIKEVADIDRKTGKKQEKTLANRYFKHLSQEEALKQIDAFFSTEDFLLCSIATIWIKQQPSLLSIKYIKMFEHILYHIQTWGICDQYCYRVLNPMIEAHPELYSNVLRWARSDLPYVQRASAVCLIHSSITFAINVPFVWVKQVCDCLMLETHPHVRKGMGWLLKYSYLAYPEETIEYLQMHRQKMSAISFRYALEKMPVDVKQNMKTPYSI